MSEKLQSGFGPGLEIETNTESRILQNFIEDNWDLDSVPVEKADFGSTPDRTKLPITLRVYRIFSNVRNADIGSNFFDFDVPVAIDVFVRDLSAHAQRREPTLLVDIDTYLRQFISTNRLGLRSKGINHMNVESSDFIQEKGDDEKDQVWFHLVVQVRMFYHMNKVSTI